jgi:hypothetical protein
LIPSGKTDKVIEWFFKANTIPDWTRPPMIAHSQVGYHPKQKKIAVSTIRKRVLSLTEIILEKQEIEIAGRSVIDVEMESDILL